jgi:ADP-L-glycero-D-manno-heptose 6-epimerase
MIVVTGGAGFIGSALVHSLNQKGFDEDIWVVDEMDHLEKQKNLDALTYSRWIGKDIFLQEVTGLKLPACSAILHMGACSSTTETNETYLRENNFEYTRSLAQYCLKKDVRFIYASSAATYGAGEHGYSDDESLLETLAPLNLYGASKQRFDLWAKEVGALKDIVGLKYFNVFGPNEYHKGDMQSMVRKGFLQVRDAGVLNLFKSYKSGYGDGGQERDFLYVRDAVAMTLFFLEHEDVAGIYNVGSGRARNWNDLASAVFKAMDKKVDIKYIEMPESIRDQYQYHTCAEMGKIRAAGYTGTTASLEEGISDYINNYLLPDKHLG